MLKTSGASLVVLPALPPAFLFDLDGTLFTPDGPVPGAADAIERLRHRGVPVRFVTNITRANRAAVLDRVASYGFQIDSEELFTPAVIAASLLRERGVRTVSPFVSPDLLDDLSGFEMRGGTVGSPAPTTPDAVLFGDLGDAWTPALLTQAFRYLMDGSLFVALQKGRYWMGTRGLELDAGAFVAALEFAAGRKALVCGKPRPLFFHTALQSAGLSPPFGGDDPPVMVGDDLWADVGGAQGAGLAGWLVRTGKFREDALATGGVVPDRVIDSVAQVI